MMDIYAIGWEVTNQYPFEAGALQGRMDQQVERTAEPDWQPNRKGTGVVGAFFATETTADAVADAKVVPGVRNAKNSEAQKETNGECGYGSDRRADT